MFRFWRRQEENFAKEPATFEQTFTLLLATVRPPVEKQRLETILDLWRTTRVELQHYTTLSPKEKKTLLTKIAQLVEYVEKLERDITLSTNAITATQYAKRAVINLQRNLTPARA